jgi:Inositol monophosphatase family
MTDAELAAHLAEVAGRLLLEVRAAGVFSAKALGKAGDQTANQFLIHAIREQRPDDGLLSEEEKDNFERLAHNRVWIIDPVDGTREYGEARSDSRSGCSARHRCSAAHGPAIATSARVSDPADGGQSHPSSEESPGGR